MLSPPTITAPHTLSFFPHGRSAHLDPRKKLGSPYLSPRTDEDHRALPCSAAASTLAFVLGLSEEELRNASGSSLNQLDTSRQPVASFIRSTILTEKHPFLHVDTLFCSSNGDRIFVPNDQEPGLGRIPPSLECLKHNSHPWWQERVDRGEKECIEGSAWHGLSISESPSFVSPRSLDGFPPDCSIELPLHPISPKLKDAHAPLGTEELGDSFLDKDDGIVTTRLQWTPPHYSKIFGFRVSIPKQIMKSMPPPPDDLLSPSECKPYFHIEVKMVELYDAQNIDSCIDWLLQWNPRVISLVCKHASGFLRIIQLSAHDRCVLIKVSLPKISVIPVVPVKLRALLSDKEIIKVGARIQKDSLSIYYFLGVMTNCCVRISQFVGSRKRKSLLELCRDLFQWDWSEHKNVTCSDWGSKNITLQQVKHAVMEAWTTRLVWVGQNELWHIHSPSFSLVEIPWILLDYFGRSVFSFELQADKNENVLLEVKGATVELYGGRLSIKQKNFRSRVMGLNSLVELHFKDGRKPQKYIILYRDGSRVFLDNLETQSFVKRIEGLQEEISMISKVLVDNSSNNDVQNQKLEESLYMLLCVPGACPKHILAALGCLHSKKILMQSRSFNLEANYVQNCKIGLNPAQSNAWQHMLSSPLSAVLGPPGTGKTTVISAVAKAWLWLASCGETLVCTAHQNVAVRHMAETLVKERIPGMLVLISADYYVGWHEDEYTQGLKDVLVVSGSQTSGSIESWIIQNGKQPPRVMLCTLSLIGSDFFVSSLMGNQVSAMIIDECSQASEGSLIPALGALPHLQMLSVVGDPCQLPPYGRRPIRSVFDFIAQSCNIQLLEEQYRMPYRISQFVSTEFYGGRLQTDVKKVWQDSNRALIWVNVRGKVDASSGTSLSNQEEAEAIVEWCCTWKSNCGGVIPRGKIVVLTLYEAQRSLISGMLDQQGMSEEIIAYNADTFQGQEADVVLISLVVGTWVSTFAADRRRACVLLSRAKQELLLFGNLEAIQGKEPRFTCDDNIWISLAKYCQSNGWVVERCNLNLLVTIRPSGKCRS